MNNDEETRKKNRNLLRVCGCLVAMAVLLYLLFDGFYRAIERLDYEQSSRSEKHYALSESKPRGMIEDIPLGFMTCQFSFIKAFTIKVTNERNYRYISLT
jgi:hypothetical protein